MPTPSQRAAFRTALRDAVRASGLTQQAIADAIGVSKDAVSRWVRGVDIATPPNVIGLERALGLDPGRLGGVLGYTDPVETSPAEDLSRAIANSGLSERDRLLLDTMHETMRRQPD